MKLDAIRKEIIKSTYDDLPTILDSLKRAQLISQKAPLREMIKHDGTPFTNIEERKMLLSTLDREINELQYINKKDYPYYRFQITCSILMLMISISDYGLLDLEKIIYE